MLATRHSPLIRNRRPLADSRPCLTRAALLGPSALLLAALLAAMASDVFLSTANATPLVVGVVPAPGQDIHEIIEGVTTDLFDVAQGTVVTAFSAQVSYSNTGTSDPRSAFGYHSSFIEPTRTIFSDSSRPATDFIDFQTSQPIDLGNYQIYLGSNEPGRWADGFRLYASSNSGDVQSHLVSSATIAGPYVPTYGSPALQISDTLNLFNVQYFRMEIDRATFSGFSGPRVIEFDGFPISEPPPICPPTVALEFNGAAGGAIKDVNGLGTGFTDWLPGTGGSIPRNDPNLNLQTMPGYLAFSSQRANIHQFDPSAPRNLANLDAPSVLLTNMVGKDFRITAKFDDLDGFDQGHQLALYVGTDSEKSVRGGFHPGINSDTGLYYLAGNTGSGDIFFPQSDIPTGTHPTGLGTPSYDFGDDVILSLSRVNGNWSLEWENLTNPVNSRSYSDISIPWLDNEPDLYAGMMHLSTRNVPANVAKVDYFRVTVGDCMTEPPECKSSLNFNTPAPGTINDANGLGTGFTHRLPGTGSALPTNDPNMDLVAVPGKLRLTSTHADINQSPGPTGNNLPILEAPGVFLPGIGSRDVMVKAVFENVNLPNGSDQLTLYAGVNENKVLRAGIHQGNIYIMSPNNGAGDMNTFTGPNAFSTGDDIEVTLSRQSGLWSLSWHNLTSMSSGSLPGISLPWLDAESNLYFGVLAANAGTVPGTGMVQSFTAQIDDFSVTCVPEPSSLALFSAGLLAFGAMPRRRRLLCLREGVAT